MTTADLGKPSYDLIVQQHAAYTRTLESLDLQVTVLDPGEDYAANTLLINECLLTPKGFPKTKQRLETEGRRIIELDVSEARKMDGGLTCMSLRF